MFKKAEFLTSVATKESFPNFEPPFNEIAFAGRSNVGKSSLINHLTKEKDLARTSSTPGKTQLINFFSIDDAFGLIDLPGYGFAKVPQSKRAEWGDLIQGYLEHRNTLKLIILLIDLRHLPTKEDIAFAKWAKHFNKPLLIVFTKADKLPRGSIAHHCKKNISQLEKEIGTLPIAPIAYSIKEGKARNFLIQKIKEFLWD